MLKPSVSPLIQQIYMKGKKNQIPAASASANTPSPLDNNNQGNPDLAYMNDFNTMLGGI